MKLCGGGEVRFETEVTALNAKDGRIVEVLTKEADGPRTYRPCHIISTMHVEDLALVLSQAPFGMAEQKRADAERSVALIYLFLNEPPRYPHAWLEVNDTKMKAGRITNYAAFNGDMVPQEGLPVC